MRFRKGDTVRGIAVDGFKISHGVIKDYDSGRDLFYYNVLVGDTWVWASELDIEAIKPATVGDVVRIKATLLREITGNRPDRRVFEALTSCGEQVLITDEDIVRLDDDNH